MALLSCYQQMICQIARLHETSITEIQVSTITINSIQAVRELWRFAYTAISRPETEQNLRKIKLSMLVVFV
jgi:hypothetical protein